MQEAFNYLDEYKLDILAYDLPAELSFDTEERDKMLDLMFHFVARNKQWLDELVPACADDQMGWFINVINHDSYHKQQDAYWKYLSSPMTEWLREINADYQFAKAVRRIYE